MRILLVGHGAAKNSLRALTPVMRMRGHVVSCYFDENLDAINRAQELPPTDFLLLGLSTESRNPESVAAKTETDILTRAVEYKIACGVVCDNLGLISAPYLIDFGTHMRVAIVHSRQLNDGVAELCEHASIHVLEEILKEPDSLLETMQARTKRPAKSSA